MLRNDKITASYQLLPEERKGVEEIRALFKGSIPSDLDTDLHLRRWIHGWKGQLNEIEPRLKLYIENRKLATLDEPDYLDKFEEHPLISKFFKYMAVSREKSVINSKDNCVFLIQRIENVDLHSLTQIVTCGGFLMTNFALLEGYQRQILKQDNLSKHPSGLTILYDMAGMKVSDFMNPHSPFMKINKLCMAMFQDYYCDILHRIYVVNAPRMFAVIWDICKHFMNKNTQEKFFILGSNYEETLQQYIDVDILPIRYGGTKRDTTGLVNPETLCSEPATITEKDFFIPKKFDDWELEHIKPHATFEVRKTITKPHSLLSWQYWVNSDIEFTVVKVNAGIQKYVLLLRLTVRTNSQTFLFVTFKQSNNFLAGCS